MSKTDATAGAPTDAPVDTENPKDAFETLMGDLLPPEETEVEEPVEAAEEEEIEVVAEDGDEDENAEEVVEEKPRRRKSPKKRIDTLLAEKRELTARIRELEEAQAPTQKAPTANTVAPVDDGPDREGLNDDGSPVYPLGDLDRAYLRDVIRYESEARERVVAEQAQTARVREEQAQVAAVWTEKLEEAEADIPDLRANIAELEENFLDLDPAYGQHLALTIMGLDNGPQVLNYLAQNLDEADTILEMGPSRATVALGRLDARFDSANAPVPAKRTTKASPPPPSRTRGTGAQVATGSSIYDKMLRDFR